MDPASIIVGALAAGTLAGTQDVAAASIKDAYVELKKLLRAKLKGHPLAETALEQHETAPKEWGPALKLELAKTDALADPTILSVATRLLEAAKVAGANTGNDTYFVDAREASRFQVGRGNVQIDGTSVPFEE